jgi:hypothetical protein
VVPAGTSIACCSPEKVTKVTRGMAVFQSDRL